MQFYQKYTYNEYQFGQQTVMFAVSDNYSEIFQGAGIETDIFVLDTLKQDLNLSEAKFAIDELGFSINQAACRNDNDKNALAFTLECKDKFRVCAVFFLRDNEIPSNDNLLFIGAIDNKVSGDDLYWDSVPFGTLINPIREYKFSALSLDISLLDECLIDSACYNSNSVRIDNIEQRISKASNEISSIVQTKFSYAAMDEDINNPRTLSIWSIKDSCKLSDSIKLFLNKAGELIFEKLGINIKFILLESDLGIQVTPIQYDTIRGSAGYIVNQYTVSNILYNLKLNTTETDTIKEPLINIRMVKPEYGQPILNEDDNSEKAIAIRTQKSEEKALSFINLKSVAEVLFSIAKALNCYLISSYTVDNDGILNVNLEFKSRSNLTESNNTYLIGSSDASFDTASTISDGSNKFYSQANQYVNDGVGVIHEIMSKLTFEKSNELTKQQENRKEEELNKKTVFAKLLLSTSQTLIHLMSKTDYRPINIYPQAGYAEGHGELVPFLLTNALYIDCAIPEQRQRDIIAIKNLGYTECLRPIGKIFGKIDGATVTNSNKEEGVQLSEYVNASLGHEKSYYETEYELTVPFWNGFSKNSLGTNCSWKNIKLGSKNTLNEDIRTFINGVWRIFRPANGTQFVVIGKEISLSTPETKLKLQNIGRFAYGLYYEGKEGELLSPRKSILWAKSSSVNEDLSMYSSIEIAEGEIILIGDAIMINPETQKAFKAVAKQEYYDLTIGIAKVIKENICYYQNSGIIEDTKYNFDTNKLLFVRTAPDSNTLNISQTYLIENTETEDLVIWIGKVLSSKSFQYDFRNILG